MQGLLLVAGVILTSGSAVLSTWPTHGWVLILLLCLQHPLHHQYQPCGLQARMLSGRITMGQSLALISFLAPKLKNITRQLYPSRKRILPCHGRHSKPLSWGPSQPPVQPRPPVSPYRHISLLSGPEATILSLGPAPQQGPSPVPNLLEDNSSSSPPSPPSSRCPPTTGSTSCSQPTAPTFAFFSVPTRCSHRKDQKQEDPSHDDSKADTFSALDHMKFKPKSEQCSDGHHQYQHSLTSTSEQAKQQHQRFHAHLGEPTSWKKDVNVAGP